ncbi:MAG: family 43 glycosylhydrolase, partial [Clostridiales bacterium]|nr:family 43 glycosylhydrolase [Clostridiales bacterium]
MRKMKKIAALALAAITATAFVGCSEEQDAAFLYYQGDRIDVATGKMEFSTDLFYRNDYKVAGADPFVLDNTSRDGYYYIFTTSGHFESSRSKDLVNWEIMGPPLNVWSADSEIREIVWNDIWAPEVIYDPDTELYYMHFSASPKNSSAMDMLLMGAVSETPYGPYEVVNFTDPESCGAENVHNYDTTLYNEVEAQYLFLNPELYHDFSVAQTGKSRKYPGAIDPHAFVDDDGKKYLYFVDNIGTNFINVVEMENWLKPKWDTMTIVTATRFWTVEDFKNWRDTGADPEDGYVTYENANNTINEGPAMIKRNGKYYLTLSINDYGKSNYAVVQAVADKPTGPFRKLREEENGLMLSSLAQGNNEVSGSGHHSFVTVDDQMYIVYHRHDDVVAAGGPRNAAIDEIEWVAIKDIEGNDLDVMYVNGPTWNVQPLPMGEYVNIAPEATVTGSDDAEFLFDRLLSTCKTDTAFHLNYVNETIIEKTTTFTFDFATPRKIRAVMI